MTIPVLPTPADPAELELVSRCIAHWRGEDLRVDLVNGQPGTFTRAATATVYDSNGVAFTLPNFRPRFEPRDWLAGGSRTHMGLLLGATDRLSWAADWRPRALGFYVEFIEAGTVGIANAGLWSVTNDAVTGARLVLDSTGSAYRLRHHNGTSEITVTLGSAPTTDQRVVLRGYLYSDGSVQLWQSINGAAETATARSAGNTLAATWGATARLRLNSVGTGNAGSVWVKRLRLVPGLPDATTLARQF